jgi:choline-phosphate cytidylyltransferase
MISVITGRLSSILSKSHAQTCLSHSLQFRQAKLSFPNVFLLVGVSSDEQVQQLKFKCVMSHSERCESVRHCRWVDEVVSDAPWVVDTAFIEKYNIDYVAHDEEPYVSAGKEDVYAFVKSIGLSFLIHMF